MNGEGEGEKANFVKLRSMVKEDAQECSYDHIDLLLTFLIHSTCLVNNNNEKKIKIHACERKS